MLLNTHEEFKGLNQFRLNPFNVLNISISANSDEAIWQGEKLVSLAKLNVNLEEEHFLSWLSTTNESEVKKAMQIIEEPLQRLLEQLFWFDFKNDPEGELLYQGLSEGDGSKLKKYLDLTSDPGTVNTKNSEHQAPEDLITEETITLTQIINSANLNLLLGLCYFHGLGPMIKQQEAVIKTAKEKPSALVWKNKGAISYIVNPHVLVSSVQEQLNKEEKWKELLSNAFKKWSQILTHPNFKNHLSGIINHLKDDLLDESSIEVLSAAIPTRLLDILLEELKELISQGRQEKMKALLQVIADSPFYKKEWKNAFHTLRQYYQIELSDLYKMIDAKQIGVLQFRIYLKRLKAMQSRLTVIDPNGVLALNQLIDKGLMKVYDKVVSLNYSANSFEEMQNLLAEAANLATVESTKKKIQNQREKMHEYYEFSTCHFCSIRGSDPDHPVVIHGRKVTSVNDDSVHYLKIYKLIPRCTRCANIQNHISTFGIALSISMYLSIVLYLLVTYR